jgi:hypothetical protein
VAGSGSRLKDVFNVMDRPRPILPIGLGFCPTLRSYFWDLVNFEHKFGLDQLRRLIKSLGHSILTAGDEDNIVLGFFFIIAVVEELFARHFSGILFQKKFPGS